MYTIRQCLIRTIVLMGHMTRSSCSIHSNVSKTEKWANNISVIGQRIQSLTKSYSGWAPEVMFHWLVLIIVLMVFEYDVVLLQWLKRLENLKLQCHTAVQLIFAYQKMDHSVFGWPARVHQSLSVTQSAQINAERRFSHSEVVHMCLSEC